MPNSCPTSPNSHRVFNPYSQYRPGGSGQVTKAFCFLLCFFLTSILGDSVLPGSRAGGAEARAGVALEHPQRGGLPNRGWRTLHRACWAQPSTHPGEIPFDEPRIVCFILWSQASSSSNGGSQHLPPPHPPPDPLTSPSRTVRCRTDAIPPPTLTLLCLN